MAAADLFGSTAGEMVKSESKDEAERWLVVCLAEALIEVMACEEEVRERAWVISCLSFAWKVVCESATKGEGACDTYLEREHHERCDLLGGRVEIVLRGNEVDPVHNMLQRRCTRRSSQVQRQSAARRFYNSHSAPPPSTRILTVLTSALGENHDSSISSNLVLVPPWPLLGRERRRAEVAEPLALAFAHPDDPLCEPRRPEGRGVVVWTLVRYCAATFAWRGFWCFWRGSWRGEVHGWVEEGYDERVV